MKTKMLIIGIVLGALMNKFCLINLFRYTTDSMFGLKRREPENWLSTQQKEGSNYEQPN
jgi:hypothetical protein